MLFNKLVIEENADFTLVFTSVFGRTARSNIVMQVQVVEVHRVIYALVAVIEGEAYAIVGEVRQGLMHDFGVKDKDVPEFHIPGDPVQIRFARPLFGANPLLAEFFARIARMRDHTQPLGAAQQCEHSVVDWTVSQRRPDG